MLNDGFGFNVNILYFNKFSNFQSLDLTVKVMFSNMSGNERRMLKNGYRGGHGKPV